jgi:hypothetical protein
MHLVCLKVASIKHKTSRYKLSLFKLIISDIRTKVIKMQAECEGIVQEYEEQSVSFDRSMIDLDKIELHPSVVE